MKNLIGIFLASIIALNVCSQSNLLNKYDGYELYSESKDVIDLTGSWKGKEIQYDGTKSFITQQFTYEFKLEQEGNKVSGVSTIQDKDGNFADMKLRGYIVGNKLHFEEFEVVDEIMDRQGWFWCFTTGELDIKTNGKGYYLAGPLDGYSTENLGGCTDTYVTMENSTNTASSLSPSEKKSVLQSYLIPGESALGVSPNPFKDDVQFSFSLSENAQVNLQIFDLNGKLISNVVNAQKATGSHSVNFSPDYQEMKSGVYLIKLQAGEEVITRQFIRTQ